MSRPESPSSLEATEWLDKLVEADQIAPWQREQMRHLFESPTPLVLRMGRRDARGYRTDVLAAYQDGLYRASKRLERRKRVRATWHHVGRVVGLLALVTVCLAVGMSVAP